MSAKNYQEAYVYAIRYCSIAEHCKSEILEKVEKFELDKEESILLIFKLEEENFLNEERYTNAFVHDKIYINKWGKQKIRYALHQKGLSQNTVANALSNIDYSHYSKNLLELLTQKKKSTRSASVFELNAKLSRFAYSRGYESDLIRTTLNKLGLTVDE